MTRRLGRRSLIALVATLVIAALAGALTVHRVPDSSAFVTAGGRIDHAGWAFGFGRVVVANGRTTGHVEAASSEGASARHDWSAEWRLADDITSEQAAGFHERDPSEILSHEIAEAVRETSARVSADRLGERDHQDAAQAAAASRLAAVGLVVDLTLLVRAATPTVAQLVNDGWPVVLVGVDGMDWQVADPLLQAGRLPHLAGLISRGVRADLRSAKPMLSPLLWTTMATGRRPEDHGVCDFLAVVPGTDRRVPITSSFREVPALWNVTDAAGLSSVFVGWWATWPAEPVRGAMVSDRLAYTLLTKNVDAGLPADVAFPPRVADRSIELLVRPDDVPASVLERFTAGAAAPDEVDRLRKILSGGLTYHRVALELFDTEKPHLASVYYELIDQVCHRFMHLAPPRRPGVSAADFAAFSGAVDAAYDLQDELLGELLAVVPDDAVVVLVSDHGFLSGADRLEGTAHVTGQPGRWHRATGVLVAAGGPVEPGSAIASASIQDVAPTVLHLLGLPVGDDMAGEPVLGLARPVRTIPSYDDLVPLPSRDYDASAVGGEALDEAAVEALVALGYVGAAAPPIVAAEMALDFGLATTASHHVNMAGSLLEAGRAARAAEEALIAVERRPTAEAWLLVSRAFEAQGDLVGAVEASTRALALPGADPSAPLRHAKLLVAARRTEEAERFLERLPSEGHGASSLAARGFLARDAGDADAARRLFRQALEDDPSLTDALAALVPLEKEAGTLHELEPLLRRAVEAERAGAAHHEALAVIALERGDAMAAVRELDATLALDPWNTMARARRAFALATSGRLDEAVREARAVEAAEPSDAEAWVLVASVHGRAERPLAVLESLERARAAGGHEPAMAAAEALARMQLQDPEGAARALRQGLEEWPGDRQLRELAGAFKKAGVSGF